MLSKSRLQIKDQLRGQDSFDQLRQDIRNEGRVVIFLLHKYQNLPKFAKISNVF